MSPKPSTKAQRMSLVAIISALDCKHLPPKSECAHHAANLTALYDRLQRAERLAVDGYTLDVAMAHIEMLLAGSGGSGGSGVNDDVKAWVDAYRGRV